MKFSIKVQTPPPHPINGKNKNQAGTVLGQAQLKMELELYFTSFKICCIKLIKLYKLC